MKKYSQLGTYWEKSNQNEIDIVALNELEKKVLIAEVKLNIKKINLDVLEEKSKKLEKNFKKYEIQYIGYSLENM